MKQIIKIFILILFLNNLVFAQGGLVKVQRWKNQALGRCDATTVQLDYNAESLVGLDDSCPDPILNEAPATLGTLSLQNTSCDRYGTGGGVRLFNNQLGTHNALRFTNGAFGFFTTPLEAIGGVFFNPTEVSDGVTWVFVIKSNNNGNVGQLVSQTGAGGIGIDWSVTNGAIALRQSNGSPLFTSTGTLSTSNFQIVIMYWDATNNVAKVWINGALDSSGSATLSGGITEELSKFGSNPVNAAFPLNADVVRIRAYCGGELSNGTRNAEFTLLNGIYGVY
jgi:hypothetical protein